MNYLYCCKYNFRTCCYSSTVVLFCFRDDVLKALDKDHHIVGELYAITTDEILLKELLLEFARDLKNKIKLYIQPVKNRYRGRQRSELYVAVSATDKQIVSLVWNLLSAVCDKTYFMCSKV